MGADSGEAWIVTREQALLQLGSEEPELALAAAARLVELSLHGERNGSDAAVLASRISQLPSTGAQRSIGVEIGRGPACRTATITLDDVKANILLGDSLPVLLVKRLFGVEDPRAAGKPLPARRPLISCEQLSQMRAGTVHTDRTSECLKRLRAHTHAGLLGESASGKTVAAAQACETLCQEGWTVTWLDLSDPDRDAFDLVLSLLRTPQGKAGAHVIALDNLQSQPGEAMRIAGLIPVLTAVATGRLQLILLGWETSSSIMSEGFPQVSVIACHGEQVFSQIADALVPEGTREADIEAIRGTSQGDLHIARIGLDLLASRGVAPSREEIAANAFFRVVGPSSLSAGAIKLLYVLSCLGQFEVDASRGYAEAVSATGLSELLALRAVRANGEFLSVGHRSLASMIVYYVGATYGHMLGDVERPVRLAVAYLRRASDKQLMAVLERLDLAGLGAKKEDQHGTAFLARAWSSLLILIGYLARQAEIDPSWSDNLASAVFAAQAFSAISHDHWDKAASFVRSRWRTPSKGDLPEPIGPASSERVDFEEIRRAMEEEDALRGSTAPWLVPAASIDYDRLHRTWALGLLLGFEGTARVSDPEVVTRLKESAATALQPDGSFYSPRVPWITARVVLGLCAIGESIRTSATVRRACEWLRRPFPDGPYHFGVWESGTGRWNTDVMTTSMCVLALVRAGVPVDDPAVAGGVSYLLSTRGDWVLPGKEIDGALAMEACLLVKERWRQIGKELSHILAWAKDRQPWATTGRLASDSHEESSKVPFVAGSLIGIIWETVKSELPALLEGLSVGTGSLELLFVQREMSERAVYVTGECVNELKSAIGQNITDRQTALANVSPFGEAGNGQMETQLSRWHEYQEMVWSIERSMDRLAKQGELYGVSPEWSALVKQIDELGNLVFPRGWNSVQGRIGRAR